MAQDIAASDKPVGTIAEVQSLNLPLNNHATCSRPFPGNKGCRHFDGCKFRKIRDGMLPHLQEKTRDDFIKGVGAGPDTIACYRRIGSTGAIQGLVMQCSDWYESGNEDRLQASARTGDAFGPFKYAGDVITQRIRTEVHRIGPYSTDEDRESAKTCPDCKKGECRLTEERKREVTVHAMLRPAEAMSDAVFGNEIQQQMFDEMQKEFQTVGMEVITNQMRPDVTLEDKAPKKGGLDKLKGSAA